MTAGIMYNNDNTLQRINEYANQDVEMKDASTEDVLYLVVDTNILLHHLSVLGCFSEDIEAHGYPVVIVVPSVVISELDGHKKNKELQWFTSRASTWLLERVKEKKSVKVQARKETCKSPTIDPARGNDFAIFDCCMFFKTKGLLVLLSADKNLCIECQKEGIPTINPPSQQWSSRQLAHELLSGYDVDVSRFQGHEDASNFRPSRASKLRRVTAAPAEDEDDRMDIDEEGFSDEDFIPSHALDSLHLQVIGHFATVLKLVALRVRTAAGDGDLGALVESQHAPGYRRKDIRVWTIGDCLEYLGTKKTLHASRPSLRVFLLRRNEDRGWRRGQDWSRKDWYNCLDALEEIGMEFEDRNVLNSMRALRPEVENIFNTPMRPTGQ